MRTQDEAKHCFDDTLIDAQDKRPHTNLFDPVTGLLEGLSVQHHIDPELNSSSLHPYIWFNANVAS
jgi:hypothetical protein